MTNQPPNSGFPEGEPPDNGPSGSQPPYPGGQQPYSGQPYPGQGQPYPGQGQPYPGQGQPYPGQGQPYPGQGQQYSGGYPAGNYETQPPAAPKNGAGIAALILGIVALLSTWTVVGGIVLGVIAIILGFVGRSNAKKQLATNGGMSLAGIILGALAVVISIVLIVVGVGLFHKLGGQDLVDCLRDAGSNQSEIDKCQDQFRQNIEDSFSVTVPPAPTR